MTNDIDKRVYYFYDPGEKNGWLANFSEHSIFINDKEWKTVEHYFQAMKFVDIEIQNKISLTGSPGEAKALAKKLASYKRKDWKSVRNLIMYNAIKAKFSQHKDLKAALALTKKSPIVEDAEDSYWGCGQDSQGKNQMGRLLMMLRDNLFRRKK